MDRAFATITDHLVDAMFLVEESGKVIYANPAAKQKFGDQNVLCPVVLTALATKTAVVNAPAQMQEEGKPSVFLLASAAPIQTKAGETGLWVVTYHDVTPQREEEQRRSYFLSIAGHEIKNPLATIRAVAQTVERREKKTGNEQTLTAMSKIIGKVDLITHLINELMDINRLRFDELEFFDEVTEIEELLSSAIEDFSRMFPQRRIERSGKVEGYIEVDCIRLSQVLLNLLTNAAKHSAPADPLKIEVKTTAKMLTVRVTDTGPGIPLEAHDHIFNLAYETPGTARRPGLGLGLYISRLILEHYGGTIGVENGPNNVGSTFFFSLPRKQS